MNLKTLMAKFGLTAKEERAEVDLKETEELTEMLSVLEANEQALAEKVAEVASLQEQLAQFAEAKAAAETAAKEAIAKAREEKMSARMAEMTKEFGDVKAAKLFKIAEKMEDAEYAEVFGLQKEMAAEEEASFKEHGVDAKAEEVKDQPTHFKDYIKKESK